MCEPVAIARHFAIGLIALLAAVTPQLSLANPSDDPSFLLGQKLPEVVPSVATAMRAITESEIDQLFDIPDSRSLDALLSAEPQVRSIRGGPGIAINRRVAPATVFLQEGTHLCSGALIDREGHILTCWHCIRGGGEIIVRLHPALAQGALMRAYVIRSDPERDLALLLLAKPPSKIKPVELGHAMDIEVGTDVYAIGHPNGLAWSIVKGMVSQIHEKRVWNIEQNRHEAEVIQTQIPLYPGNSGGPLVSDRGLLIGINSDRRENELFAFAISISDIRRFLGGDAASPEVLRTAARSCKRRKFAEGRNAENTASLSLYDTDCDNVADTVLIVPDDANHEVTIARTESSGRLISAVRIGRSGQQSTYILGKKSVIHLDEALKAETLSFPVR